MPWRNFLSPEFRTKFQREVPLFLEITKFPFNTVSDANSQRKQKAPKARAPRSDRCNNRQVIRKSAVGIRTVEAVNGILVENTSVGVETLAAGDVAAHRVKHHCTVHTVGGVAQW